MPRVPGIAISTPWFQLLPMSDIEDGLNPFEEVLQNPSIDDMFQVLLGKSSINGPIGGP